MPTIDEHKQKYERNLSFAKSLEPTDYLDWEIVGYFYAILHKVHIYLHLNGVPDNDIAGHENVKQYIELYLPDLAGGYATLLSASYIARYKEPYRANMTMLTMVKDSFRTLDSKLTQRIKSIMDRTDVGASDSDAKTSVFE